jgi:DNA polymerase eta
MTSCEKCGKYMLVWELPEHMDFHFAQDIQKELRQEDAQMNRTSIKRKSDVISPEKSKKKSKIVENVKTLTNFFSKK